jgi:hypothetical protein
MNIKKHYFCGLDDVPVILMAVDGCGSKVPLSTRSNMLSTMVWSCRGPPQKGPPIYDNGVMYKCNVYMYISTHMYKYTYVYINI